MIKKKYIKKKTTINIASNEDKHQQSMVVCEDIENESEGGESTLNFDIDKDELQKRQRIK